MNDDLLFQNRFRVVLFSQINFLFMVHNLLVVLTQPLR